jgi:GT2 family glycosyltransferase
MGGNVPDPDRPDISVIIVNRNTRELLRACLASIRALPDPVSVEVIVVDNGSTDGSVEMVAASFPETHLIRNERNTGFAYPNNQGIAVSRGRYVMLLNSDTEVRHHALARLVEFMDARPDAGACGPALFYPDGRPQPSCRSFPSLWGYLCDMLFLDRVFPRSRLFGNMETWFDHRHTAPVDQPMGAALLVRRETLDEVGPLDERFVIYYNDVDWCYRIHRAGWGIYFVHDAEVVHHQGVTTRSENAQMQLGAEMTRNVLDYFQKHFGKRGLLWFRFWTVVGFSIRRVVLVLPAALRPAATAQWESLLFRGMLRAAWTGNPDQFSRNPT